jgi:hypothetical protein
MRPLHLERNGLAMHPRQQETDRYDPRRACDRIIKQHDRGRRNWQHRNPYAQREQSVSRKPQEKADRANKLLPVGGKRVHVMFDKLRRMDEGPPFR